jgi:hypothetical protein
MYVAKRDTVKSAPEINLNYIVHCMTHLTCKATNVHFLNWKFSANDTWRRESEVRYLKIKADSEI